MRLFSLVALLGLLVLATAARAWEQTDYEVSTLMRLSSSVALS